MFKKQKRKDQKIASAYVPVDVIEDSKVFANEDLDQLYKAIRQLSEVDRAVILLYLEERPYLEIAQVMGTSANNIAVRIRRIKND